MSFRLRSTGSFSRTNKFLDRLARGDAAYSALKRGGERGVDALSAATPVETGLTAASWRYKIDKTPKGYTLRWYNTNIQGGSVIALLIQYGHGTGTGGYIAGRDYINPAIQPIFDQIADDVWKQVIK